MKSIVSSWIFGVATLFVFFLPSMPDGLARDGHPKDKKEAAAAAPTPAEIPAPGAAVGQSAPMPEGAIPLSKEDGKDARILELSFNNLDLARHQVDMQVEERFHFQKQQADLHKQQMELQATLAKAYNIDLRKYQLDLEKKAFVPLAPPAPQSSPGAASPANAPPVSHVVPAAKK